MTISCVLIDIEGTIVPISFVRDVLFPYARHRMAAFLRERREDQSVRTWAMQCQDAALMEQGVRPDFEELPRILEEWIDQDRKLSGLKGLQGLLWEEGYRTGAFTAMLYDDVLPVLKAWRAAPVQLALYSSGSEHAQRLLISHTNHGDITGFFSHCFDTSVGPKMEPESYRRISKGLALAPEAILFLSDVEAELNAALAAGFQTTQIVRPGTEPGTRHCLASDFREVAISGIQPASCFP